MAAALRRPLAAAAAWAAAPRAVVARRLATAAAAGEGDKLAPPAPPGKAGAASPKIEQLVGDIAKLTLLETAELVTVLKQRLNIADVQMAAPVAAAAAPAAGAGVGAAAAEAKPAAEKTEFKVKLESFDAAQKVNLIKAVKEIVKDLNLIAAKKFVEEAPKVLKESASKEEAQKIKADLEKLGAKITVE